jgi:hypothetical protein
MQQRHATRAALAASVVVLAEIAVFGNQWFQEHVVFKAKTNLASALVRIPAVFSWRFSPLGSGANTLWFAQWFSALLVVVGVFLLVRVVASRSTGASLLVGTWGVVVLVGAVCAVIRLFISYGDLFGDVRDPQDFGRFWYSVLDGPTSQVFVWGLVTGAVAALAATLLAGPATGASPVIPLGGPVEWQGNIDPTSQYAVPPTYGTRGFGTPAYGTPEHGVADDTVVVAVPPPAPWGGTPPPPPPPPVG